MRFDDFIRHCAEDCVNGGSEAEIECAQCGNVIDGESVTDKSGAEFCSADCMDNRHADLWMQRGDYE